MEENVRELTAYCGLYCGDCIRYRSRAADLAGELLRELEAAEFEEYARIKCSPARQMDNVPQLQHYPECLEVLETIVCLKCETPCRKGGGCNFFSCDIAECCGEKNLEGCWQCPSFRSCDNIAGLQSIHGRAPVENLKMIRTLGIDDWAEQRCKPYIWQQSPNPDS
jgi:hypothetical protein